MALMTQHSKGRQQRQRAKKGRTTEDEREKKKEPRIQIDAKSSRTTKSSSKWANVASQHRHFLSACSPVQQFHFWYTQFSLQFPPERIRFHRREEERERTSKRIPFFIVGNTNNNRQQQHTDLMCSTQTFIIITVVIWKRKRKIPTSFSHGWRMIQFAMLGQMDSVWKFKRVKIK